MLRIRYTVRLDFQIFLFHDFNRIVNIQLEIGHNGQMIPQLAVGISRIPQIWEHAPHYLYNGIRTPLTLVTVSDGQGIINHVLYTPAIFR